MSCPLMPQPLVNTYTTITGASTVYGGGSFTVPTGTTSVSVNLLGAKGGKGGNVSWNYGSASGGAGGFGAGVLDTSIAVTPGEVLTVSGGTAGANGANYTSTTTAGSGGNGTAGTTVQFLRGATVLMSAGAGGAGGGASCGYGGPNEIPYENSGSAGGNSGTGSGGTVTAGGGSSGAGYAYITWSAVIP